MASSIVAGGVDGSLEFDPLPQPTGGPTITLSGSGTIVAGGAFFLQVAPEPGATVDTLLASIQRDPVGYFEVDVQGAAPPYLLIGQVPDDLDPTRPGVGICVTAVHALDRVGRTACRNLTIADALPGDVQVTLSWDVDSAVDLLVLDPERESREPGSAGRPRSRLQSLLQCCSTGVRNEHVAWSAGGAEPGVYSVRVRLQDTCDTFETNYVVGLKHGEETSTFSGKLKRAGQEAAVTTFRVDGPTPPAAIREEITETYAGSGDAVFSLNPEGEILDETPFTLRLGNAAADVYLIATNTGHHPMQPHVVRLDRTQSATAAGLPVTGATRRAQRSAAGGNPTAGRSWITEFNNNRPLPLSGTCRTSTQQTPQPVTAGTTHFDFLSLDGDRNRVTIPATARKVVVDGTTTLVVWVADRDWVACTDCVGEEMVDALAAHFLQPNESNDILQLVTAIFGDPWGTYDGQCLIPAEFANVLHILLYDIDRDGPPEPGEARDRGFFWAKDNYLQDPSSAVTGTSNERLMIYLDAPLLAQSDGPTWEIGDTGPRQALATLIHELQHMIHFYQKRVRHGVASEIWLNEMASEIAEGPAGGEAGNLRGRRAARGRARQSHGRDSAEHRRPAAAVQPAQRSARDRLGRNGEQLFHSLCPGRVPGAQLWRRRSVRRHRAEQVGRGRGRRVGTGSHPLGLVRGPAGGLGGGQPAFRRAPDGSSLPLQLRQVGRVPRRRRELRARLDQSLQLPLRDAILLAGGPVPVLSRRVQRAHPAAALQHVRHARPQHRDRAPAGQRGERQPHHGGSQGLTPR